MKAKYFKLFICYLLLAIIIISNSVFISITFWVKGSDNNVGIIMFALLGTIILTLPIIWIDENTQLKSK